MTAKQLLSVAGLATATTAATLASGSAASWQPEMAARLTSVKTVRCDIDAHEAIFRARMRRVRGADRMSMHFTVMERVGGGGYTKLHVPGLRRWRKSRHDVARYGYRQRVRGLRENAVYRARVDFRWLDADGGVIRRGRRRSGPCSTARRSNLTITSISAHQLATGTRYAVRVRNRGNAASPQAAVALSVDGAAPVSSSVPALAPDQAATASLRAARCNDSVVATVDPGGGIAELNEHDNSLDGGCPPLY